MPWGKSSTLQEKFLFGDGPLGDRRRPAGTGQHGHHGDDDDADQRMLPIDGGTRILQFVKVADDFVQADVSILGHDGSSVFGRSPRFTEDNILIQELSMNS